jgi:maltose/moltooligosaccharide transporter
MIKPRLSFWQIWNMSFGFLGIQVGWTLQMNNISAIYEYLGAKADQLPILFLAAPVTGLLVQPLIGHWSDNTWNWLGRRRPFFLVGAILSSCMLVLMPLSSALWMAAGALWILDASINVSMEPFRAFVADMLPDEQRARGFTMQSFFIGIGNIGAAAVTGIVLRLTASSGDVSITAIPMWVRLAFWIGAAAFLSAVLWTIVSTKEYPPSDAERDRLKTAKAFDPGQVYRAIVEMPGPMRQLAAVQFCTWVGLFCLFLYFAVAVARSVFGAASPADPAYSQGIVWAGYCSGFYSGVCAVISPFLPSLVKRIGKCKTHSTCLLAGAAGFLSIPLIHDKWLLLLPMVGVGVAWASILSMPYSILAAAIPQNKMGVYMGIFNFFIVLPEITASLAFGWIMSHLLGNNRMAALVVGGMCFILAAILTQRIREPHVQESDELIPAAA